MITGYKQQKRPVQTTDEAKLAEDLNMFYTRFDKRDFHMEQEWVMSETQSRSSHAVVVSDEDIRVCFRKVNPRSATGPDKVSGRTPKECSESLAPVFTKLIQMPLDKSYIPRINFSTPCSHISWFRNFSQCLWTLFSSAGSLVSYQTDHNKCKWDRRCPAFWQPTQVPFRDVCCLWSSSSCTQLTAAAKKMGMWWSSLRMTHPCQVWSHPCQVWSHPCQVWSRRMTHHTVRPWRSWLSGATGTTWSWTWPRLKNLSSTSTKVNMDPIVIRGQPVETVTNYKYLGTIIDNKLDWSPNIEACCKKANQCMYFLRKLEQFKVDKNILVHNYQTII